MLGSFKIPIKYRRWKCHVSAIEVGGEGVGSEGGGGNIDHSNPWNIY